MFRARWSLLGVSLFVGSGCIRSLPDIPADPNGVTVAGRVVERDIASGQFTPVPQVNVVVAGLGIGARTDADGRFEIPALPLGSIRLVFSRPVVGRDPVPLKVLGGLFGRVDGERLFVGEVDVRDPGALHGAVSLADAPTPALAEGTLVAVAETAFRAVVSEDGRYALARIPEGGTFDVVAFRAGYAPARVRGVTVLANTSLELAPLILVGAGAERTRAVTGAAQWRDVERDSTGITIACVSETSSTAAPASVTTDATGAYRMTLEYGLYACEARHPDAHTVRLPGVAVLPEGVIGLVQVRLTPVGDPATSDLDGDGIADATDPDRDGDGTPNATDVAPDDPELALDTDGDGTADQVDFDDDDDGLIDGEELSRGRDGVLTDPLRADSDEDGVPDGRDLCPATPDPAQVDTDGDGRGDACDVPVGEEPLPVVPLEVLGFAPARAGVGVAIAVRGRGFDPIARSNVVTFAGDILAQGSAVTADRLSVVVPPGAGTGPISIYNGRTVVTSTGALVIVPPPLVTNINPPRAAIGQRVTLTGRGLTAARVFVGTTEAVVLSASDTEVEFVVPAVTAIDWTIEVRAEGGVARPSLPLTVLGDARITALIPQVAGRGQLLRILGSGLAGRVDETTVVEFSGSSMPATPTLVTSEEVRVVVPDDAQTGAVVVVRGATRVTSGGVLSIDGNLATIRSIDPWLAVPGETVQLGGDNFGQVVRVRVSGVEVPHRILSPTSLEFDVPLSGVRGGRVTVESTDAGNRTVTSTSPEGLSVLRLVNRRAFPVGRTLDQLILDPTRDVAYVGSRQPYLGRSLDLPSLIVTGTVTTPVSHAAYASISPNGRYIAASNDVTIWAVPAWQFYSCGVGRSPFWTVFSSDSRSAFAGTNMGIWYIDLSGASPTCRLLIPTLLSQGGLHSDSTRQLLVDSRAREFAVIDADPTSPTFGMEAAPRWAHTDGTAPRAWSPPGPGRVSGEAAGGGVWVLGPSNNGLVELVGYTTQSARPMTGPPSYDRVSQTLDRRWAVRVSSGRASTHFAIVDFATARVRDIAVPQSPNGSLIISAAGSPGNWVVALSPGTRELFAYQLEAAALE